MAADWTADAHDAGLQVAESLLVAPGGAADAHDAGLQVVESARPQPHALNPYSPASSATLTRNPYRTRIGTFAKLLSSPNPTEVGFI